MSISLLLCDAVLLTPSDMEEEPRRPKSGDIVIWDVEPERTGPIYWVGMHDRGTAARLFEGPDAWTEACSAAEELAGTGGVIWKRYKDGRFERFVKP